MTTWAPRTVTGSGLRKQAAAVLNSAAGRLAGPPRTGAELSVHLHAIGVIVDQWTDGKISTEEKRALIAAENAFYYGREKRSPVTGVILTSVNGHAAMPLQPARAAVPDDEEPEPQWWQK